MSAFSNSDLQNYRSVKRNILLLRGVALIGINSQFKCGVQQQMKMILENMDAKFFIILKIVESLLQKEINGWTGL